MAEYKGSSKFVIPRPILLKDGVNIAAMAGNITMTYRSSMYQLLTNASGSHRNLVLPAEKSGASFWIKNQSGSTHNISVNDPSGSGVVSLTPGETGHVVCDGTSWTVMLKG